MIQKGKKFFIEEGNHHFHPQKKSIRKSEENDVKMEKANPHGSCSHNCGKFLNY